MVSGKNVKDSSLTGKDLKDGSVTGTDVGDGSIAAGDLAPGTLQAGPQGPKGDPGAGGQRGEQGKEGVAGIAGEAGSAVAYGEVEGNSGLLFPEETKNIVRSAKSAPQPGGYCLQMSPTPKNVVATITGGSPGEIATVIYAGGGVHCAAGDPGYNVFVSTWDVNGALADRSFQIAGN